MLKNDIIGKTTFRMSSESEPITISVFEKDYHSVVQNFFSDESNAENFNKYIKLIVDNDTSDLNDDSFRENLIKSISIHLNYGRSLYFLILEQMLKDNGINVKWSDSSG